MGIPWISKSKIRKKLLVSVVVLGLVIAVLGYSSFRGVYAYRDLATTLSSRASEMPFTAELTRSIDDLRLAFQQMDLSDPEEYVISPKQLDVGIRSIEAMQSQRQFSDKLHHVRVVLARYKSRLEQSDIDDPFLSDLTEEFAKSAELTEILNTISLRHLILLESHKVDKALQQMQDLERLSKLAHKLPTFFGDRMASFKEEVKSRYRTWIVLAWSSDVGHVPTRRPLVVCQNRCHKAIQRTLGWLPAGRFWRFCASHSY